MKWLKRRIRNHLDRYISAKTESINRKIDTILAIVSHHFDDIAGLRQQLRDTRRTQAYADVFTKSEPLVSVRIATYQQSKLLIERAVRSVQSQTYKNWELIIVGDHCTDDTEEAIAKLNDARIRYFNLPYRGVYPEDPKQRWLVAGTLPANYAVELAQGDWIAPLDHDDEFTHDHIELLVTKALQGRYEVVYGKIKEIDLKDHSETVLFSSPPSCGQFGFQSAIYLKVLDFFEYNINSWVLHEAGDWNLMKRMLAAGVLIGHVEKEVTTYFPYHQCNP